MSRRNIKQTPSKRFASSLVPEYPWTPSEMDTTENDMSIDSYIDPYIDIYYDYGSGPPMPLRTAFGPRTKQINPSSNAQYGVFPPMNLPTPGDVYHRSHYHYLTSDALRASFSEAQNLENKRNLPASCVWADGISCKRPKDTSLFDPISSGSA